jgi:hypothetical protein
MSKQRLFSAMRFVDQPPVFCNDAIEDVGARAEGEQIVKSAARDQNRSSP